MTETLLLIQCAVIGFSIALPVGPVAILCIRRTLGSGLFAGLATGIGAAVADTIFGGIAIFGLTFVADFIDRNTFLVQLVGGCLLLGMGIYYVSHRPPNVGDPVATDREHKVLTIGRFLLSSFVITLFNPLTLGAFAAVFAASGVGAKVDSHPLAVLAMAGVAMGAAAWWLVLTVLAQSLRRFISHSSLQWLNWVTGGTLIALGGFILVSLALPRGMLPI